MKKMISMLLVLVMALSLAACGTAPAETTAPAEQSVPETTEAAKPETITIQALNANKEMADIEVPYDPQRIAILDMPALDIVDALGLGDRIVGSAKVTIEYLTQYNPDDSNGAILNLGSVKTADLEQVAICEPDIIFIGGRLSSMYAELEAIAPVVYLAVDYEKGVVESTRYNAQTIASIFGKEAEVDAMFDGFQPRIDALNAVLNGRNILLAMYNNNAMSIMDTQSQLNILAAELGGSNLGETVGEVEKATHGEDASWETIVNLNPEYIFVLDRSTATGAALGNKIDGRDNHVFCVIGDGEADEGQVWEALHFAYAHKLDNIVYIFDNNGYQLDGTTKDILDHGSLAKKAEGFGLYTQEIDGHDVNAIYEAIQNAYAKKGVPSCIVLNTSKGKGATFAEPKHDHSSQPKEDQWVEAIAAAEKALEDAKNA